MKLIRTRRRSRLENRYHPNMGRLCTQVTRIEKHFMGIPIETVHKYRETYNGEIKDCEDCVISKVELDNI
ncbi:hypothetical protein CW751_13190 [Brumimicrobium salinarum]|uniref:Uncharacterized protein n=2 Tax=Brumimicrobium salinarum TaxID=2058658 RepID=A0A2I0QZM0_9FLAO|nr:hypothetical protein CW751_13190 [Brumimicrobium salinarum]